jgi:hypothetical protein
VHSYGGEGGRRIPAQDCNFHRDLFDKPWRSSMKPLDVVQVGGRARGWVGGWVGGGAPQGGRSRHLLRFVPGCRI